MGWRWVEASVLSALVIGAVAAGVLERSWFAAVGAATIAGVAVVAWTSLAAAALRRLRQRPTLEGTTLELISGAVSGGYTMAAFFSAFALVSLAIYTLNAAPTRPAEGFLSLPFACSVVAVVLAGWRHGVRVHAPTRRLVRWRGVQLGPRTYPIFERLFEIDPAAKLEVFNASYGRALSIDKPAIEVHHGRNADVVRLRAEQLAKALAIPIVDRTAPESESLTRAVHELDLPLSAQLQLRGKTSERRPLPEHTTLELQSDVMPWVVRMRPRGLRRGDIASAVFIAPFIFLPSLIPGLVITTLVLGKPTIVIVPLAVLIAIAISWFGFWRPILRARRERQVAQLSSSGIRVVRSAPGSHSAGQLAAEQIEEIVLAHNTGFWAGGLCVVARGDDVSLAFGHELELEDAIWLRDTAIAALAPRSIYR